MITNCNIKNNTIMENTETTDRKPLLSVIVPVYNVKDYVERCVDSIINYPCVPYGEWWFECRS